MNIIFKYLSKIFDVRKQGFLFSNTFSHSFKEKKRKKYFYFSRHDMISTKNLLRLKRMPFTLNRKLETGFKDVDGFTDSI